MLGNLYLEDLPLCLLGLQNTEGHVFHFGIFKMAEISCAHLCGKWLFLKVSFRVEELYKESVLSAKPEKGSICGYVRINRRGQN